MDLVTSSNLKNGDTAKSDCLCDFFAFLKVVNAILFLWKECQLQKGWESMIEETVQCGFKLLQNSVKIGTPRYSDRWQWNHILCSCFDGALLYKYIGVVEPGLGFYKIWYQLIRWFCVLDIRRSSSARHAPSRKAAYHLRRAIRRTCLILFIRLLE